MFIEGCIDKLITRTAKHALKEQDFGNLVLGHDFILMKHTDPNIQVLKCEVCGKISAAWLYNEVSKDELKRIENEKY